MKTLQNLVSGEDDELRSAYENFHKMVEEEQRIVGVATLVEIGEVRREHKHSMKKSELVHAQLESMDSSCTMIFDSVF